MLSSTILASYPFTGMPVPAGLELAKKRDPSKQRRCSATARANKAPLEQLVVWRMGTNRNCPGVSQYETRWGQRSYMVRVEAVNRPQKRNRSMIIGDLALVSAALFTGAAFSVNFAEQPARLKLDDRSLLAQWKPAYKRGYIMQSTLAIIGFVLGAAAWWLSGILAFLLGAVLMLANWPWTLFGIMPTNRILMATELQSAGSASRALLLKWNSLHAVRTGLGAAATLSFLWALA